jgi:hypothetical protein
MFNGQRWRWERGTVNPFRHCDIHVEYGYDELVDVDFNVLIMAISSR